MSMRSNAVWGALTTLVGVMMFVTVVVLLHFVQIEYDPKAQLMSELALGRYGWAMIIAFFGLAIAVFGVQVAVAPSRGSRAYRALLVAAALSFLIAGIFPLGATSMVHIGAIGIAFVLSVLSMYLFPTSVGDASVAASRRVSWPLAAGVAVSVALGHSALPIGIGQRLAAACLLLWLGIVGWNLYRLRQSTT